MDVSHFELIWKPQSPAAPTGTPAVANVIQGYFLEITNLESVAYQYRVELVASPVTDPLRSLAGNTVVFVDTPGTNNQQGVLNGAITDTSFFPSTGNITIPPKGTALIAVLPSAFGPLPGETSPLTAPNFEVRGFVRVTLPATFRRVGNFFLYGPQANAPVKVMLTPQNRTTYFSATGAVTDQTQATLLISTGTAINSLPPEPGFIFPNPFDLVDIQFDIFERMATPTPQMLAAMLAMVDADGGDMAGFNDSLAKAGIGMALERRRKK
jgi:hypothetical protein